MSSLLKSEYKVGKRIFKPREQQHTQYGSVHWRSLGTSGV